MTYLESYKQCNTADELISVVRRDAMIAMMINPDRIKPIEKAMNEVINERGWHTEIDGFTDAIKSASTTS